MIVRGLTAQQIYSGVASVPNAAITGINKRGKGFRVKLSVKSTKDGQPYYRLSAVIGRRHHKVFALCWHGFREVIRAWYRLDPNVVIISAYTRYENSHHFERTHDWTGYRNVGSQAFPQEYREACNCEQ